jgi:protease I
MEGQLNGKRVAILATDGFEQSELLEPRKALKDEGAETFVVSNKSGKINGWNKTSWGTSVAVDMTLDEATAGNFDALMLPGGVMNPDHMRADPKAVEFVREFVDSGKPIAAICHAPWMLVEADACRGRRMTSYHSIRPT